MMILLAFSTGAFSPLHLNSLFSDGVVLQRNQPIPVFGVAPAGSKVKVTLSGGAGPSSASAIADSEGKWIARLAPRDDRAKLTLEAVSDLDTITVKDVKLGEVWIASGQSNMEFAARNAQDFEQNKAEANDDIRFFMVNRNTANERLPEAKGTWISTNAKTVGAVSAVAFGFARELRDKLGVPVGILQASWGGTPAEAWTSANALSADPILKVALDQYLADVADLPARRDAYAKAIEEWIEGRSSKLNGGFAKNWQTAEFDDSAWTDIPAGSSFEALRGRPTSGAFWIRKTIEIPREWLGKPLKLELGPIDTYEITYFDGVRVGRTDEKQADAATRPRVYRVAPGIVREGKNVISIRVVSTGGPGGLSSGSDALKIGPVDGSAFLPLDGTWKFEVEKELPANASFPKPPNGGGNPNAPTVLSNAMLAPLAPFGVKGAIWYQGEANIMRAAQYRTLFPAMINDWRELWGQPEFPFYFVQLPNYNAVSTQPVESAWAELREAQTMALDLPKTGMAVTIDLGEPKNIHPRNKRPVSHRLAQTVLSKVYRQPAIPGSPRFVSMRAEGNGFRLVFENGSLTTSDNQLPRGFAIAGEDRKFVWADARIDGSTVFVSSNQVPKPKAIRYGWADNPDVNVTNRSGFPLSPFRTDSWTGVTDGLR